MFQNFDIVVVIGHKHLGQGIIMSSYKRGDLNFFKVQFKQDLLDIEEMFLDFEKEENINPILKVDWRIEPGLIPNLNLTGKETYDSYVICSSQAVTV